jgi:hypothetical protein
MYLPELGLQFPSRHPEDFPQNLVSGNTPTAKAFLTLEREERRT